MLHVELGSRDGVRCGKGNSERVSPKTCDVQHVSKILVGLTKAGK